MMQANYANLQFENHVRSLTETDNQSSGVQSQGTMNDSTISVNDKLKRRIKQKVMKYQNSRRSQSR